MLALPSWAESDWEAGSRLIGERKYNQALTFLVSSIKSNPTDVSSINLAANCCMLLGERNTAYELYWHIVRAFPSSKESYTLRTFLRQNDPLYASHASNNNFARSLPLQALLAVEQKFNANPKSATAGSSNAAAGTATASSTRIAKKPKSEGLSKSEIINAMLKVVRPLKDHPSVSKSLVDNTKSVLMRYPDRLLELMYDEGYTVCLTPTLIDRDPGLTNTQPSGYEDGHTFKDCPGMFDPRTRQLVICEYTIGNGFDCVNTSDPMGTLLHEAGHAIDFLLGAQEMRTNKQPRHIWYYSETEEYKHAYLLDSGKINDDAVKTKLSYFLQKSDRGPAEAFAELMCQKYGGGNDKYRAERGRLVTASFPQALAVIEARLAQLARTGK